MVLGVIPAFHGCFAPSLVGSYITFYTISFMTVNYNTLSYLRPIVGSLLDWVLAAMSFV